MNAAGTGSPQHFTSLRDTPNHEKAQLFETAFHVPKGHPETMKRPIGWVERSATHQVFSKQRHREHRGEQNGSSEVVGGVGELQEIQPESCITSALTEP